MFVAAAYEGYWAACQTQIAGVYVGGYVHAGEVADVHGAIGIWESSGDECALIFFCHFTQIFKESVTFLFQTANLAKIYQKCKEVFFAVAENMRAWPKIRRVAY